MELSNDLGLILQASGPDAFLVVDSAGEIVFANDRVAGLFGWTKDELIGGDLERLVPDRFAADHPSLRSAFARDPASRRMGSGIVLWARRKDGSEFPVEVSLGAVETERGLLTGAAIRDVTDALRASKRSEAIVDSAPDALLGVGVDGRIVLVNARAVALFGWPASELVGRPIEMLVPASLHERHRDKDVNGFGERPKGVAQTLSARRRDGTDFPAEVTLSTVTVDPDRFLVLAAIRDISDRVAVERESADRIREGGQEQTDRLEALGQLAGGVAHDFNNLLGVILNYATLIARSVEDPQVIADVEEVVTAANRGATLTRQLLTFARRRDVVAAEPSELNGIVRGVVSMLERTLGERIQLKLHLSKEPLVAVVDRGQIEQVIVNLAINARDAMQGEGILTIDSSRALIDRDQMQGDVTLRVTDTGSGMASSVMAHAFEPFFTTKDRAKGTGLGLATAYGIVRRSGGDISIESAEGEGTTVTIRLPATDREAVQQAESEFTATGGRECILFVEDEDPLRVGTARLLREHGYHVVTAVDGVDALEIFDRRDHHFDLVLTDIAMPRMRGDQLEIELAKRDELLPLIFMSGYASREGSAGEIPHKNGLLQKPVDETALLRAIRQVLEV